MDKKDKLIEFVTIEYDNTTYKNTVKIKAFLYFVGISFYEFNTSNSKSKYHDIMIKRSDAILVFNENEENDKKIYINSNNIRNFLEKCFTRGIISETKYEELLDCLEMFEKFEYAKLLSILYNQRCLSNSTVDKAYKTYKCLIDEHIRNRKYEKFYMKYSLFLTTYEMDYLCKMYEMDRYYVTPQSIITSCIEVNNENEGALNYNFVKLAAKIQLNILENVNEGINLMKHVLDKDIYSHTAWYYLGHIYFKKTWYKDAIKYLGNAIEINNSDYVALYKIACCYVEIKNKDMAFDLARSAVNSLRYKADNQEMDNLETEFMFAACILIVKLIREEIIHPTRNDLIPRDERFGIKYCLIAKDVITKKTKIYDYLEISYDSDEFFEVLKETVDISYLKKAGIELSSHCNLTDIAKKFINL